MAKAIKTIKKAVTKKKTVGTKLTDAEMVLNYMNELMHPLKAEMEEVRKIILDSNKKISERIKWKAPSYYYKEDMVTFNGWAKDIVHLVFHHPHIVNIESKLLEGDYPSRRMTYFRDMKQVKANKKELQRIMNELVNHIDTKKQ